MSDIRDLLDRSGLDPDPAFVADLEQRLRDPSAAEPLGQLARRRRHWVAGAILASAAAITAVAVVLTAGGRPRVVTTPGTVPTPSSVAVPSTVAPPSTTVPSVDLSSFSPSSVTFVSPTKAWALGVDGRLVTTGDRGATWHVVQTPPAKSRAEGTLPEVRFANASAGYIFGGDLWSTHDGAARWQHVLVPGADDASELVALETADGTAYVVFTTSDGFRIASSPVARDHWTLDPLVVPYGAGPVPEVQLVLQHGAGWLLENDRVVTAGARLVGGAWSAWTPPCVDGGGPAALAASDASHVVALCQEGIWGGPSTPATRLHQSSDSGLTFNAAPVDVPVAPGGPLAVASADEKSIVVAGAPGLSATFDGGKTWETVWPNSTARWTDLGYTTKDQGVAVLGHDDGTGDLLLTTDGGHHWNPVSFGG